MILKSWYFSTVAASGLIALQALWPMPLKKRPLLPPAIDYAIWQSQGFLYLQYRYIFNILLTSFL